MDEVKKYPCDHRPTFEIRGTFLRLLGGVADFDPRSYYEIRASCSKCSLDGPWIESKWFRGIPGRWNQRRALSAFYRVALANSDAEAASIVLRMEKRARYDGKAIMTSMEDAEQDTYTTPQAVINNTLCALGMSPGHRSVNTPAKAQSYILEAINAILHNQPVCEIVGSSTEPKGSRLN